MSTLTEAKGPQVERRYIFIGGGSAAGGWLTNLGPDKNIDIAIPTVAPVHVPMVGGFSEASVANYSFRCTESQLGKIKRKAAFPLLGKEFLYIGSAAISSTAGPELPGKPRVVKTLGQGRSIRIDERIFVDEVSFSIESSQAVGAPTPTIKIEAKFPTLTLDGYTVDIEVDTKPINNAATQADLEKALKSKSTPSSLRRTLPIDPKTGGLLRNSSNYTILSFVKSIRGKLPPGASVEPNGYTIDWPGFGKIILGEVLITPYMRRVSTFRIKHSDLEGPDGCGGGSDWP